MSQNLTQTNIGRKLQQGEKAVLMLMRVMMTDYNSQYKNICTDKKAATAYKNRLLKKLDGFSDEDILDGYELCTEESPKFMPTIPDLFSHVCAAKKDRVSKEKKDKHASYLKKLELKPKTCDPMLELKKTKIKKGEDKKTTEERKDHLAKLMRNHSQVLAIGANNIKKNYSRHQCANNFCKSSGNLSSSTNGSETWYCPEHFRQQ